MDTNATPTEQRVETTTWHMIEIEDRQAPSEELRVKRLAIEVVRSTSQVPTPHGPRLVNAEIELRAELLDDEARHTVPAGSMGGNWRAGVYTLTGGSMLLREPLRGFRLGTYMQNEVLRWAMQEVKQPGSIRPISLSPCDAKTNAERDRRNRFYGQFNIRFVWDTPVNGVEHAQGRSDPALTINDVKALDVVNGVRAFDVRGALHDLARRVLESQRDAQRADRAREYEQRDHERERHGWRIMQRLGVGIIAVLFAALILALRFR